MSDRKLQDDRKCKGGQIQQNTLGLQHRQKGSKHTYESSSCDSKDVIDLTDDFEEASKVQQNVLTRTLKPNSPNDTKRKSDTDILDNIPMKRKILQSNNHKEVIDLTNDTFESGLKTVPALEKCIPNADDKLKTIFNNCDTETNKPNVVDDEDDVNLDFLDDLDIDIIVETLKACAAKHENAKNVKQVAIVSPYNSRESHEDHLDVMHTTDKNKINPSQVQRECTDRNTTNCETKEILPTLKLGDHDEKITVANGKGNKSQINETGCKKKETSIDENKQQVQITNSQSKFDVKSRKTRNIQCEENKIIPIKAIPQETNVKKLVGAFISPTIQLQPFVRDESFISDKRPTAETAVTDTSHQNDKLNIHVKPPENELSKSMQTGIELQISTKTKKDIVCSKTESKADLLQPKVLTENTQSSSESKNETENQNDYKKSKNKSELNKITAINNSERHYEGQSIIAGCPEFVCDYSVIKFGPALGEKYNAVCKNTGKLVRVEVFRPPTSVRILKILEELKAYQESLPEQNRKCLTPINIYDFGIQKIVVTQFYSVTLRQEIDCLCQRQEYIKFNRLRHLCVQLVMAVFTLRCQNIVHADISPKTILLGANSQLKLGGFHWASKAFSPIKHFPDTAGTLNYRAPEIIIGAPLTSAIDTWASACVVYEMAACAQLFPGHANSAVLGAHAQLLGQLGPAFLRSDISPKTILLGANSQLKLGGFHWASKAFSPIKHFPDTAGTLNYRAPEIIIGAPLTSAIDTWASACVVYEMAACAQLFPGHANSAVLGAHAQLLGQLGPAFLRSGKFTYRHWRPSCHASQISFESIGFALERNIIYSRPSDTERLVKLKQLASMLRGMLELVPEHRSSIELVCAHAFFGNDLYD